MSNVKSDAETIDTIFYWVFRGLLIIGTIWVINQPTAQDLAAQYTDMVPPRYEVAKPDCDQLARENQDSLELVSLESENYGSKNGKRFVVYQTMMFGEPRQRLCVHWGDQIMFPPILQQASYMQ